MADVSSQTPEPTPPLKSARAVFLLAEAFAEAAEMLQEQFQQRPSGESSFATEASHISPRITLDALATELYFKCLHLIDRNSAAWGHEYRPIFDNLSSGMQQSIRYHYNLLLSTHPIVSHANKNLPGFSPSLDNVLDESHKVFDTSRYLFEGTGGPKFYWPLLRLAVRETIFSCNHPDWRKK